MRAMILPLSLCWIACATPTAASAQFDARARSGPYSLEVVDASGGSLPTFWHRGRVYVLGTIGQRYLLRVRNESGCRAEVVVSVDGRDVIDGRAASWEKRGYLVEPGGVITIDGYRLSEQSVAAFRFSTVPRSYAALEGDARDVGVIGMAVFPERQARIVSPPPYERRRARGDALPPASSSAPKGSGEGRASAAPSRAPSPGDGPVAQRPGLGTEFAEEHASPIRRVPFERASARPDAVLTLRYDDRQGLAAVGIDVDRRLAAQGDDRWLRDTAEPFRRDSDFAKPPPGWGRW